MRMLLALFACGLPLAAAGAEPTIIGTADGTDVVTVRGVGIGESKQADRCHRGWHRLAGRDGE